MAGGGFLMVLWLVGGASGGHDSDCEPIPCLFSLPEERSETPYPRLPDTVSAQIGGYAGALALGGSWVSCRGSRLVASIGYTPESLAGVTIWQATARAELAVFRPWSTIVGRRRWAIAPLSLGVGVAYGHHDALWVLAPSQYEGPFYYNPTALRGLLSLATTGVLGDAGLSLSYVLYDFEVYTYVDSHRLMRSRGRLWGLAAIGSLGLEVQWRL